MRAQVNYRLMIFGIPLCGAARARCGDGGCVLHRRHDELGKNLAESRKETWTDFPREKRVSFERNTTAIRQARCQPANTEKHTTIAHCSVPSVPFVHNVIPLWKQDFLPLIKIGRAAQSKNEFCVQLIIIFFIRLFSVCFNQKVERKREKNHVKKANERNCLFRIVRRSRLSVMLVINSWVMTFSNATQLETMYAHKSWKNWVELKKNQKEKKQ